MCKQELRISRNIFYSRQSLSRSLNKRRRKGTTLVWVGSGKEREVREGKEKRGRIRRQTWKGETNNSRLPAAKGFLGELGEMRCGVLIYTRTGANSILFATVPFTLADVTEKWNRTRKVNVRYVLKNPDTCQNSKPGPKTQRRENPVLQHWNN